MHKLVTLMSMFISTVIDDDGQILHVYHKI